jgi:hypothetical protein
MGIHLTILKHKHCMAKIKIGFPEKVYVKTKLNTIGSKLIEHKEYDV